ncbi:Ribonucleases P/MRP protein [Trichinella spiralis]|uniref:Ribonucleases P/MRP protein n=1 Tax=Trichinella spiralis TaxID=6334 RepID=A0ABR3KCC6_TRISP
MSLLESCPRSVDAKSYVQRRVESISQLLAVVDNEMLPKGEVTHGPRTFLQRLPRHMRRRAMSRNVKRLPRRCRFPAQRLLENAKLRKKLPNRSRRRRPSNLVREYVRRQGKCRWLETHIWHAKRFRMVEAWQFKLALGGFQRSWRATFRDAAKHATMRDVSHMILLRLSGQEGGLLDGLRRLCSSRLGLTFSAASTLDGSREGSSVLYRADQYPFHCIGPVNFLWQPSSSTGEHCCRRILWLWIHPSVKDELIAELCRVFGLVEVEKREDVTDEKFHSLTEFRMNVQLAGAEDYCSADESGVKLTIMDRMLLRFRLTGPKSTAILDQALNMRKSFERKTPVWPNVWHSIPKLGHAKCFAEIPPNLRHELKTLPDQNGSQNTNLTVVVHCWTVTTGSCHFPHYGMTVSGLKFCEEKLRSVKLTKSNNNA